MLYNQPNRGLLFLATAAGSGYFWKKRHDKGKRDELEYIAGVGAIGFTSLFLHSVQPLVFKPNTSSLSPSFNIQGAIISALISIVSAFLIVGFSASYARGFFNQNKNAASIFVSLFILVNSMIVLGVMTNGVSLYSFRSGVSFMTGGRNPIILSNLRR